MLFGGLLLLVGSLFFEQAQIVFTSASIFILAWLAIMASIVQFAIWFFLLEKGDPGKVSAFLFLAPFFGVIFGWLLLNEQLHISTLVGGVLILAGIFLVNYAPKKKENDSPEKTV